MIWMMGLGILDGWAQAPVTGGDVPELDAQRFRPTLDGTRTFWTDDGAAPAPGPVGRVLLSYTGDPLVYVVDDQVEALVETVVQANVLMGWGLGPARVGIDVPVTLFADGTALTGQAGLGDLALDGKVAILGQPAAPLRFPVDVAIQGRLGLPTSTIGGPLGSPEVGYELAVVGSWEVERLLLAANVGTRGGSAAELENLALNDAFVWRAGVGYAATDAVGLSVEAVGQHGYASALANLAGSPIEAMVGGYAHATPTLSLRAGIGRGLTPGIGSPDLRVIVGLAYAPDDDPVDTDGDGLLDRDDPCPDAPEDVDAFEDRDGCPDLDNDADRVLDVDDACPMIPEDEDGWQDSDGCPDPTTPLTVRVVDRDGAPVTLARVSVMGPGFERRFTGSELSEDVEPGAYTVSVKATPYDPADVAVAVVDGPPQTLEVVLDRQAKSRVVITRDRIDLAEQIYFRTASGTIKPESYALLDEAVQVLVDYPQIRRLRIEGHTDSRGSDVYNLDLSTRRAAAVLAYLVEHGIDPDRLISQGFGESKPLDTAETPEAWARNRRVDFFVDSWVDE